MNDEPKPNDPLSEYAERLGKALADQKMRKEKAAELAAQHAPRLERLNALQEQLDTLPQHERRQVLDAIGQTHVSAVPPPLERVRSSAHFPGPLEAHAQDSEAIQWNLWLNLPQVALWEGVALVLGIEPRSLRHSQNGWMAGPGRGPFFEPRSFPSTEKRKAFDDALLLADRAASYDGPPIHIRLPERNKRMAMVTLSEVVAFFAICQWADIPAPLLAVLRTTPPLAIPAEPETPPTPASEQAAEPAPLPLTTGDIAFCFAGIRWDEEGWKKPLGDKPKWLAECVAIPGRRGVSETRWNPVKIAAALFGGGYINQNSIRARFQTKPLLNPWLDAWKTYEADYLDNP